jgi:hypothetical protein
VFLSQPLHRSSECVNVKFCALLRLRQFLHTKLCQLLRFS